MEMRVVVNLHPFNYSESGWSEVTAQLPDNLARGAVLVFSLVSDLGTTASLQKTFLVLVVNML